MTGPSASPNTIRGMRLGLYTLHLDRTRHRRETETLHVSRIRTNNVDVWDCCVRSAQDASDSRAEAPQEASVVWKPEVSGLLPATALRCTLRLTVCWVVVADSRHAARPGCTEKKGSRRDGGAADGHVTLHGPRLFSHVLCFQFVQKGPSLDFWLLSTDKSPHTGHMMR